MERMKEWEKAKHISGMRDYEMLTKGCVQNSVEAAEYRCCNRVNT